MSTQSRRKKKKAGKFLNNFGGSSIFASAQSMEDNAEIDHLDDRLLKMQSMQLILPTEGAVKLHEKSSNTRIDS